MKLYAVAMATGLLVGLFYDPLNVRSPAPPVVALVGLLGTLLGEQVVPIGNRLACAAPVTREWLGGSCGEHVLGQLPGPAQTLRPTDRKAS